MREATSESSSAHLAMKVPGSDSNSILRLTISSRTPSSSEFDRKTHRSNLSRTWSGRTPSSESIVATRRNAHSVIPDTPSLSAVPLDHAHPGLRRIGDLEHQAQRQQVDVLRQEDVAVRALQQPVGSHLPAPGQSVLHVDPAEHAVLGGSEREVDDPPAAGYGGDRPGQDRFPGPGGSADEHRRYVRRCQGAHERALGPLVPDERRERVLGPHSPNVVFSHLSSSPVSRVESWNGFLRMRCGMTSLDTCTTSDTSTFSRPQRAAYATADLISVRSAR